MTVSEVVALSFNRAFCCMTRLGLGSGEPKTAIVSGKKVRFASAAAFERGVRLFQRTISTPAQRIASTRQIPGLTGVRVIETDEVVQPKTVPRLPGLKKVGSDQVVYILDAPTFVRSEMCTAANCRHIRSIFGDEVADMLTEAATVENAGHA